MRQVSKISAYYLLDRIAKRTGKNTEITRTGFIETDSKGNEKNTEAYYMELHGNPIACVQSFDDGYNVKRNRAVHITLAGWNTVTTRERLNTLLKVLNKRNIHIVQHKHQACLRTFSGNKALHAKLNEYRWYDVTELEHIAHQLRVEA